jgi:hypothetical protein
VRGTTPELLGSHRGSVCPLSVAPRVTFGALVWLGKRDSPTRHPLLPLNAGTAEPFRVSPPEAVAYQLELALRRCKRATPLLNWVLIRYYFDYESAQIWRSEVLETSRHAPAARQPCQVFDGTPGAASVPRRVTPAQAEAGANAYAAVHSGRRPATNPPAASSGDDPYRNAGLCTPEVPKHDAG